MTASEIVLGILLKGAPENDDYVETIEHVPAKAELAALKLLDRNPTNGELLVIVIKVPSYRRQAWSRLLEQQPTNDELIQIIKNVPDLCNEAWEQLLKQCPANADLISVITGVHALQISAWQLLTQRSLTEAELLQIYDSHCSSIDSPLRDQVARMLTCPDSQKETLIQIAYREATLREQAIWLLLGKTLSKHELVTFLEWKVFSDAANKEICVLLMQESLTLRELRSIVWLSKDDALKDKAAGMMLDQEYDYEDDEDLACFAALGRPALAQRALYKLLIGVERKSSNETQLAQHLYRLYSKLVSYGASCDLQAQVACKFLQVTAKDQISWRQKISEILSKHPELKVPSAPALTDPPPQRQRRRTRTAH